MWLCAYVHFRIKMHWVFVVEATRLNSNLFIRFFIFVLFGKNKKLFISRHAFHTRILLPIQSFFSFLKTTLKTRLFYFEIFVTVTSHWLSIVYSLYRLVDTIYLFAMWVQEIIYLLDIYTNVECKNHLLSISSFHRFRLRAAKFQPHKVP